MQVLNAHELLVAFQDHQQRTIELRQIFDAHLFAQAASVFTAAFLKAYEAISDEDIKLAQSMTRTQRLDNYFRQEELEPFGNNSFFVIGAFHEQELIGYISFDQPTESGELYIRQLALNPYYWQSGIGKKLIYATLQVFPDVICLALVTRRTNECARMFYTHLAFTECQEYVHPPWDPQDFVGYKKLIEG